MKKPHLSRAGEPPPIERFVKLVQKMNKTLRKGKPVTSDEKILLANLWEDLEPKERKRWSARYREVT